MSQMANKRWGKGGEPIEVWTHGKWDWADRSSTLASGMVMSLGELGAQ